MISLLYLSYSKEFFCVAGSDFRYFLDSGFLYLCESGCYVGYVGAFVSLPPMRDWSQIGRVGLKDDLFQRYLVCRLWLGYLLESEASADAYVPVSELLDFTIRLDAAAIGVEYSSDVEVTAFLKYVQYEFG